MPSTDSELDDKNSYEFIYSMFKAQGDDEAYNRLTPAIPRNQFGIVDPNDALEVISSLEKNRISDLFKVLVSTNRIHVLKGHPNSPPGTMQFVTDQATVISQDSCTRGTPRVGSYRAVVTLIPREDRKSWVGARVIKTGEKEIIGNDRVIEYAGKEEELNERGMKEIEQGSDSAVRRHH